MRRSLALAVVLAVMAVVMAVVRPAAQGRLAAQSQDLPRFTSSVEVTSIDVSVFDDRGRPVTDLKPSDFVVKVEGTMRLVVSAEVQFAELVEREVEEVERVFDKAAFYQLLGHDAAERFDVERLAGGEVFHAAHELGGAGRDVLATPRDFFGSGAGFQPARWGFRIFRRVVLL